MTYRSMVDKLTGILVGRLIVNQWSDYKTGTDSTAGWHILLSSAYCKCLAGGHKLTIL